MALRSGPITRDASTVAVGLAQIRVGNSAANIANAMPCLTAAHSIGALADTKMTSSVEYWKLESGFPAQETEQILVLLVFRSVMLIICVIPEFVFVSFLRMTDHERL